MGMGSGVARLGQAAYPHVRIAGSSPRLHSSRSIRIFAYMTAIPFNTLRFANRLKAAGVPDKQAEAEAEAIAEVFETGTLDLATKSDLREYESVMRNDLEKLETGLRGDMEKLETGLRNDMEKLETGLRHEMSIKFAKVDGKIALLQWMLGFVAAGVLSLVLKAFLPA
jgi:hypothetical protein